MKFSAAILSAVGLAAVAHAASGTTSAPVPTTTSAETKCLDSCATGDVKCQASCVGDPSPNSSMIADTTSCVAACPKGKGSESDNSAYEKCLQSCISSSFLPSGTAAAAAASTTGSSDATTTATDSTTATSTATSGASSTGSSGSSKSGSSASSTGSSDSSSTGSSPSGTSGGSDSTGSATGSAAASTSSGSSAASNVKAGGFITGAFAFFAAVLAL